LAASFPRGHEALFDSGAVIEFLRLRRHFRVGGRRSSTAKLVIQVLSWLVIPAQAGIHLDLAVFFRAEASTPPAEERVTFFAGAKKVTKENTF
jgi:hypothetical protein